ncbi:MAG: Ribosome-binding ATPase YchF [Candidatus Omnitrophica bacterium ADurb.Bin205]|nr:MAG: Ribosome-binding ATPase YchF [Candidatus Omnitrophica bacterium ADurb.Bin205]
MKIGLFSLPALSQGKHNIKDERLDQVDKITKSKKKVYIQADLIGNSEILDADVVLAASDSRMDLILSDLEFIENRLPKVTDEIEGKVLNRFKEALEKEEFLSGVPLDEDEKKVISGYGLITTKPVVLAGEGELADQGKIIFKAFRESGFISFFTTGEKETRAWLIRKGASAWEASGAIHSDIQKGFIRAEIISFNDFVQCGGEILAKQAGKLRLEQKDYIMQDCDLANFRFNK